MGVVWLAFIEVINGKAVEGKLMDEREREVFTKLNVSESVRSPHLGTFFQEMGYRKCSIGWVCMSTVFGGGDFLFPFSIHAERSIQFYLLFSILSSSLP